MLGEPFSELPHFTKSKQSTHRVTPPTTPPLRLLHPHHPRKTSIQSSNCHHPSLHQVQTLDLHKRKIWFRNKSKIENLKSSGVYQIFFSFITFRLKNSWWLGNRGFLSKIRRKEIWLRIWQKKRMREPGGWGILRQKRRRRKSDGEHFFFDLYFIFEERKAVTPAKLFPEFFYSNFFFCFFKLILEFFWRDEILVWRWSTKNSFDFKHSFLFLCFLFRSSFHGFSWIMWIYLKTTDSGDCSTVQWIQLLTLQKSVFILFEFLRIFVTTSIIIHLFFGRKGDISYSK